MHIGNDGGDRSVYLEKLGKNSIVYSVGIGHDISFDVCLIDIVGCNIHAFDPTPASLDWLRTQVLPDSFCVHTWGLADYDGTATFFAPKIQGHVSHTLVTTDTFSDSTCEVPVRTLATSMEELGHTHIDLLKMDIEGAEYTVIPHMFSLGIFPNQIVVEIHHRFNGISLDATKKMNQELMDAGYEIADISPTGQEYTWIRTKNI